MTDIEQQRAHAADVLQQGLVAIREATVFRFREPYDLPSDARVKVGYLADAIHNIPQWLMELGIPDSTVLKDVERAKQIIAELRAIPSHRHTLIKRDKLRPSPFAV